MNKSNPWKHLGLLGTFCLCSTSASLADEALPYPMIPKNPIYDLSLAPATPQPGKNYSVKMRIVEHGIQISPADLDRQIQMTEKAYSTCPGVNFHVNYLGSTDAPATTVQDHFIINTSDGAADVGDVFQTFFSQFTNRPETGVLVIHLFDTLDAASRAELKAGQNLNSIFEGQAYNAKNMDHIYTDTRSPIYQSKPLSEVGGNSVVIGWATTKYDEAQALHINSTTQKDKSGKPVVLEGWRNQSSALFAHEMGHVLMEKQDGTGNFRDHYCFGLGDYCPQGYLMSAGGFNDRIFLDQKTLTQPIGYTALPTIDTVQCQMLLESPLVSAE
jgi:hypothetical protein